MNIDTLIHARWLIPVEPAGTVHEHWSVAIDRGRIVELLPSDAARDKYRAATEVQRSEHVLIPGLVNAHTHSPMTLLRGMGDDLDLTVWLEKHIWPAEAQWVGPEFVRDGAELAIAEMLMSGTTCFSDMYYFPDVVAQAAIAAGMRVCAGMIVVDFPSAWAGDASEYIAKGLELHDRFKGDPLVSTMFAPHAPYSVSVDALKRIRRLADQLDVPVHMHVHETAAEVSRALDESGMTPLDQLEEWGLLNSSLLAVHMTQLQAPDIQRIAKCGAQVIHCPESNLKLASGFCPVSGLLEAGVNVALGTDGAASNNDLDMLSEMRTAALLAKAVAGDARAVSAHDALRMATLNGARALGLESETGSLKPEKWADVACISLDGVAQAPVYDAASQIVYTAGRDTVSDVWVAGRHLLDKGHLTRMDTRWIKDKAAEWAGRIGGSAPNPAADFST